MSEESIHFDVGGSGTFTASGAPYNTYYWTSKVQYLLLADELSSFGFTEGSIINGLSFRCSEVPGRALANFYIRMRHFEADTLGSSWITTDLTLLYHDTNIPTSAFTVNEWFRYNFNQGSEEFIWNGTDNILIDVIRVDTGYTTGGGNYVRTGLPSRRMIFGYQDSGSSYPGETLTVMTTRETEIIDTILHGSFVESIAGTYISEPMELSAYGTSLPPLKMKWLETVPADSTLTVETAVTGKVGESPIEPIETDWSLQSNNSLITGLPSDLTDMFIWVRITMERVEGASSPTVDWLVIYDSSENPLAAVRVEFNNEHRIIDSSGTTIFTVGEGSFPYSVFVFTLESPYDYNYLTSENIVVDDTKTVTIYIGETSEYIIVPPPAQTQFNGLSPVITAEGEPPDPDPPPPPAGEYEIWLKKTNKWVASAEVWVKRSNKWVKV